MNRLLVVAALAAIVVIGAFNIRVVGQACLAAFADADVPAIFASCDAAEFTMAAREFGWEIQEPDGYIDRQCGEPPLAGSRLCASR